MKIQIQLKCLFYILTVCCLGCDDFIEIDAPRTELVKSSVFSESATAEAAVVNMYLSLRSGFASGGEQGISALASLSSDELVLKADKTTTFQQFYSNDVFAGNAHLAGNWSSIYSVIYQANSIIEGISNSVNLLNERDRLIGEAKFIRAFCYFYLVNVWGDVPLTITTDYETNSTLSRASIDDVYDLIISDLLKAQELLPADYSHSSSGRTRVNEGAASALLARVYLYREDWSNAEIVATKVIDSMGLYSLESDLNETFQSSSSEAIFQLWNETYPVELLTYIVHPLFNGPAFGSLRENLINSFEVGDLRFTSWINSLDVGSSTYYGATKYKSFTSFPARDYSTVLRLAEQYLIRSEARAHLNKLVEAANDVNVIRNRAGLSNTAAMTQEELLNVVIEERYHELFTECGHRWFDLKRTRRAKEVLEPLKPQWNPEDVLYPVPESQLISNSNITQNPG